MARLHTLGTQKALIVHLFGQRGGKGTCPSLRDALKLPSNRRGCPGTGGGRGITVLSDLRSAKWSGSLCPLFPSGTSAAIRCSLTTRSPVPWRNVSHCPTIFFFHHCKFYYLKGMELGNERCGKIPRTKALISIISTLPWISFSVSSSSVLGSSLGVIKDLLKL